MKLPVLHRSVGIQSGDINKDARTVSLSFSSEDPYERWWGIEILGHNANEVNLKRLANKAALLDNHDTRRQIGVIESTEIKGGKGYATVRFSKNPDAEEVFQDVLDGIKSNVSVGYAIDAMDMVAEANGKKTYRVTNWEPMEISMVSIPADTTVGVGRVQETAQRDVVIVDRTLNSKPTTMETQTEPKPETKPEIKVDHEAIRQNVRNDEVTRIRTLAKNRESFKDFPNLQAAADEAMTSGKSIAEFNEIAVREFAKTALPSVEAGSSVGTVTVPKKLAQRYSLVKAIREASERNGPGLTGVELEMSREVEKRTGRSPGGFFVPEFALTRDLATLTNAGGGYTVESELLGTELVDLLRHKMFVMKAGARYLGGLQGNVLIPRQTGAATMQWVAENAAVTESDQTFGQFSLAPHTGTAQTTFSKQLIAQSSIDVEGLVRNDLNLIIALGQDLAAIAGSGSAGQATGILNLPIVSGAPATVTFGATATWAKILAFESAVAALDADVDTMKWITSPGVRGAWKGVPKVSAYPTFLWENDMVNGYGAFATNQVPSNKVIFGNWADLIIANWAGIDVVTDPYTKAGTGEIVVTIRLMMDIGIRRPQSFCYSTDSGAQ
jgi:HK97 family phage major capsid protein/HK97 family phage prohead protease